jgi:MYXO-CTERM domain-containing protein
MSIRITSALSASALLFGLSILPSAAHAAALDKCGGIFLTSASQCEFKPTQDCNTTCATTSVEQSCAAQTYTTCSASCTTTDVTSCMTTHSDSCSKECDTITTESSHDVCVKECSSDCTSDAVSKNDFGGDATKCGESCGHDCSTQCDSCSTTDQMTDCTTKCMAIVQSECMEEVNRDCVLSCQTDNYDTCTTNTVNTCTTSCQDKGGAIFCDGQFVSADNLQDCADQLASEFSFNINVTASASATVSTATNDTKSSNKCSFGAAPRHSNGMILGALAVLGIAVTRRRRRA